MRNFDPVAWTMMRAALIALLFPAVLPELAYRVLNNWSLNWDESHELYLR